LFDLLADQFAPGDTDPSTGPVEPLAGMSRTWVTDLAAVRPGPPPSYGSDQFLAEARELRARAEEAAVSPLYGGIHFRSDNDTGREVGTKVGNLVVEWAQPDGAGS
jgi:hypothetical protein